MQPSVLREPDSTHPTTGAYPEKTTRIFTTTIKDEAGVAIPGSSLTSLVWTLYSEHTLAVVNGRSAVDIKANVDGSGLLTLILLPADMAILQPSLSEERHRALFEWVYSSGKEGRHEARITVSNLAKVP